MYVKCNWNMFHAWTCVVHAWTCVIHAWHGKYIWHGTLVIHTWHRALKEHAWHIRWSTFPCMKRALVSLSMCESLMLFHTVKHFLCYEIVQLWSSKQGNKESCWMLWRLKHIRIITMYVSSTTTLTVKQTHTWVTSGMRFLWWLVAQKTPQNSSLIPTHPSFRMQTLKSWR